MFDEKYLNKILEANKPQPTPDPSGNCKVFLTRKCSFFLLNNDQREKTRCRVYFRTAELVEFNGYLVTNTANVASPVDDAF